MKKLLMLAIAAAILSGCERIPELRIYAWRDHLAPEVIEGFAAAYGCKVSVDTFDSNEAMCARLDAGNIKYDIIMPSSYLVEVMVREGMVRKLDRSKLSNVSRNFDPRFAGQILDSEFRYCVPYAVTYTGFVFLKDKIPSEANVNSWSILGNEILKGKLSLLDDPREVIGAGLMYNGFSVNSTDPNEIEKAADTVIGWRANNCKFDAASHKTEVPAGIVYVGQGYSNDAIRLMLGDEDAGETPRDDIGFALPEEGFAIAFDEMVVPVRAPHPDLAHAFIDYVYDGEVAKTNMEYAGGLVPVKPGIEALDAGYREKLLLMPDILAKGQVIKSWDVREDAWELYSRAWARIKSAEVSSGPGILP